MSMNDVGDLTKNVFVIAAAIVLLLIGFRTIKDESVLRRVDAIERRADREEQRLADVDAKTLEERLTALEEKVGIRPK